MTIKRLFKNFGPLIGLIIWLLICYLWMRKSLLQPSDETGHAVGIWLISTVWCILATMTCIGVCIHHWRMNRFLAVNYLILILFIPPICYLFAMSFWIINSELVNKFIRGGQTPLGRHSTMRLSFKKPHYLY